MCHALIFDAEMIVSHAIADLLASLGFSSCNDTSTEEQAAAAAAKRAPDLVIIGDSGDARSALDVARSLPVCKHTPVLLITADPTGVSRTLATEAAIAGPVLLNDICTATALARRRALTCR